MSRKGRPRKSGPRHKGGKLIQRVSANERVAAGRAALMGDAEGDHRQADEPMILAFARGWLTERQLWAGQRYARAWVISHPQRRAEPATGHLMAPTAERDLRSWGEVPGAEIVALFDAMMDGTRRQEMSEATQAQANARYNRMSEVMEPAQQRQVFECFCLKSWPQWVIWQAMDKVPTGIWAIRKASLLDGLTRLDTYLTTQREAYMISESVRFDTRAKKTTLWFAPAAPLESA